MTAPLQDPGILLNKPVTSLNQAHKLFLKRRSCLQPIRVNDPGFPPFPINKAVSSFFSLIF
ncbi:hypothetical protein Bca4012_065652 [Brassica carinata]